MDKNKYEKYLKNQEKYKMKKELKMKEMEQNKKIDRRSTRTRQPAIAPMATERLQKCTMDGKKCGLFHSSALMNSTILNNTPIISIDPGHKNVLSSATCVWKGDQTTYNPQKPKNKNGSLSLGE